MKQFFRSILFVAIACGLLLPTVPAMGHLNFDKRVEIVVKLNSSNFNLNTLQVMGVEQIGPLFDSLTEPDLKKYYRLTLPDSQKNRVISYLSSLGLLDWMEINQKIIAAKDANDEFFTNDSTNIDRQWYLAKIGASSGWDITTDANDVIVAIIDTGIDGLHQDLNDGRVIAGHQVYCQSIVNDVCTARVIGNIVANANSDDNGHGTAVASVVGAIGNNFAGVAGVAWHVKLMPVKVLNKDGIGTASDVAEGIVWAAHNGADIINLSLGGATLADSNIIDVAADIAVKAGAIVVAAAGNDRSAGVDLDVTPTNPVCADGPNDNVLGVAATDFNDRKAVFSNYGSKCIDISAPGTRILTAHFDPARPDLQNIYAYRSGTSFAAPLVSGSLALLKSKNPTWSVRDLVSGLIEGSDNIDDLNVTMCGGSSCSGKLGAGRLNLAKALSARGSPVSSDQNTVPAGVSNGSVVRLMGGSELYYVESGQKRLLTPFVANQRGLNIGQVLELSAPDFAALPLGEPLPPLDGTLIKSHSHPLVSVIKNGIKHPLTFFSFTSHNFSFNNVVALDDAYVQSLREGRALPPPEGILVRERSNPTVYVVENGELHAMTLTAFRNRNFRFTDVRLLPDGEITLYPIGTTYYQ